MVAQRMEDLPNKLGGKSPIAPLPTPIIGLRRAGSISRQSRNDGEKSANKTDEVAKEEKRSGSVNEPISKGPNSGGQDGEAVDKELEKELRTFVGYHGYLPREDVVDMLKKNGDYLIRVSETVEEQDKVGDSKMLQVVISVAGERKPNEKKMDEKKLEEKISEVVVSKHLPICKKEGMYYLSVKKKFSNIKDLIEHYKVHAIRSQDCKLMLKRPVPFQLWEFQHCDVKLLGKQLGKGEFGVVQLGELTRKNGKPPVKVAIKSTKGERNLTKEKIKVLMKEARIARFFKNINVIRTYGVAVDEQPIFILIEHADGGSLKSFVRDKASEITTDDRLSMTLGAARGLQHLHSHEIVHCDVAARNCLVTMMKIVKISDFGLSTHLKSNEVHSMANVPNLKLPIKWLAPETLRVQEYSHKTDVYTFGVLTFEIFTAKEPYETNKEAKEAISSGRPLEIPKLPEKIIGFYKERIFNKAPEQRPTMDEIIVALKAAGARENK